MTDPLADMLTQIRNAQSRRKEKLCCPASKLRQNVLEVMKKEGYITDYSLIKKDPVKPQLEITLKYFDGEGVINELERISKPSRRVYANSRNMPQAYARLGIFILSTSRGIISDLEARKQNLGGEILCKVF